MQKTWMWQVKTTITILTVVKIGLFNVSVGKLIYELLYIQDMKPHSFDSGLDDITIPEMCKAFSY